MRTSIFVVLLGAACVAVGCSSSDDPASYVTGLRLLAIKAEPPEVAAGATSTLTALVVDVDGKPADVSWAQCLAPALQGYAVNPDCITNTNADYLQPLGSGLSVTTTMPMVDAATLGRPDGSGGVYVPEIAHVTAGSESLTASYQLRLNLGTPANQNPALAGVFQVLNSDDGANADGDGRGTPVALDDTAPLVVHTGDRIRLRAKFSPGSAETYAVYDSASAAPRSLTETLAASWFTTAGSFSDASSGADVPDRILRLDAPSGGDSVHLPASGDTIDLWIVGRDDRGGTDYLHRTLRFE